MGSEKNIKYIQIQEVDTNLKRLQGIESDVKAQVTYYNICIQIYNTIYNLYTVYTYLK